MHTQMADAAGDGLRQSSTMSVAIDPAALVCTCRREPLSLVLMVTPVVPVRETDGAGSC